MTIPSPAILSPTAIPSSSMLLFVIFVSSTNSVSLATDVLVAPESTTMLMDRQLKLVTPMTEDARSIQESLVPLQVLPRLCMFVHKLF